MSANYDIPAEQGSDFWLYLRYLNNEEIPFDFSNYTAKMEVRRSYELGGVLASFSGNPLGATVGLTGGYGGITLNVDVSGTTGATGGILLYVSGSGMADMPVGKFVYDIQVSNSNGSSIRLMEGRFDTTPSVTK